MQILSELKVGDSVLVAVPTADTLNRLKDICSGSPIAIQWDHLCLQIAEADYKVDWQAKGDASYGVKFLSFGIQYNEDAGRTVLAGIVTSDALQARARACGMDADFQCSVIFNDGGSLAHSNKSFIASVATTLVSKEETPFTFGPETIVN